MRNVDLSIIFPYYVLSEFLDVFHCKNDRRRLPCLYQDMCKIFLGLILYIEGGVYIYTYIHIHILDIHILYCIYIYIYIYEIYKNINVFKGFIQWIIPQSGIVKQEFLCHFYCVLNWCIRKIVFLKNWIFAKILILVIAKKKK